MQVSTEQKQNAAVAGVKLHDLAQVDQDCIIGDGTVVWQFASIIRGSVIGSHCTIGSCAVVDYAVIGDRCKVGHGAQIHPGAVIRDDVFVGPGAIFCNDAWPSVDVSDFKLGETTVVYVHERASIGAGAIILPGCIIGRGALVAAGAVVRKSVPPKMVYLRDGSVHFRARKNRVRPARW